MTSNWPPGILKPVFLKQISKEGKFKNSKYFKSSNGQGSGYGNYLKSSFLLKFNKR